MALKGVCMKNSVEFSLWVLIQLGVIGLLWNLPIPISAKLLIVGFVGLYTLRKLVYSEPMREWY